MEEFGSLSSGGGDVSALVERANRYANGQRQYADYLEQTGQDGYAAFQYQEQPELTVETFASGTADLIGRMEAGAGLWRERVNSYCEQLGLTSYELERYVQERQALGSAYFHARQRVLELLYAAEGALPKSGSGREGTAAAERRNFDTVELSCGALERAQDWNTRFR